MLQPQPVAFSQLDVGADAAAEQDGGNDLLGEGERSTFRDGSGNGDLLGGF